MKRYLEARRRTLAERPRLFKVFVERLTEALGEKASIIVFGGRVRTGLETVEPRDYDVLIVVGEGLEPKTVDELVDRLRPRGLPLDIIVARVTDIECNPVVRRMLEESVALHDPLRVVERIRGSKCG